MLIARIGWEQTTDLTRALRAIVQIRPDSILYDVLVLQFRSELKNTDNKLRIFQCIQCAFGLVAQPGKKAFRKKTNLTVEKYINSLLIDHERQY